MSEAIKPDYFSDFTSISVSEDKKELDGDTTALATLSHTAGWKVLKETIENIGNQLDEMVRSKMASGASLEDIGQFTVTKELTKDVLKQIINRVSDARDLADRSAE